MHDSLYEELKKTADKALHSESMEEGMHHLASAFSLFSQESRKLKNAYLHLQAELKKTNRELKATHHQLQEKISELSLTSTYLHGLLKHISQGILFLHMDGTVLSYNEAAEKILGIPSSQVLYQKYDRFFKDDFFGFSLKDALDFGIISSISYVSLHLPSQEKKEIEVFPTFLHKEKNPYQGLILLIKDMTQLEKLHQLAARSDRLKQLGEMASTIAHEIKNPLGVIRGYAALLQRDLSSTPQLKEMTENIMEGVKLLDRFVAKMLLYTRPMELSFASVDLAMFLRKTVRLIQVDPCFPKNVFLKVHISFEPFFIPIDQDAFRSCLWNLIVNAFQAMPKGGEITLSLLKQDQQAILTLADAGDGIEEKYLEQIFSPFFTTKEFGNGLGLAEVHKIIQGHRGKIEVRSQVGKGSVFTITLPLRR